MYFLSISTLFPSTFSMSMYFYIIFKIYIIYIYKCILKYREKEIIIYCNNYNFFIDLKILKKDKYIYVEKKEYFIIKSTFSTKIGLHLWIGFHPTAVVCHCSPGTKRQLLRVNTKRKAVRYLTT